MKISVIVPIYNVENYLSQCLDSIVSQSYKDLEIILVNDGSTDNSGSICDEYASLDSRINVIHQPNAGVSVARNTGILNATCDYITFVDSDDWIEPNMYKRFFETLQSYPDIDVIMADYSHVSQNSKHAMIRDIRKGYYNKAQILADFYPVLLVTEDFGGIPVLSVCNCLIKKNILVSNNILFDSKLRYGEDYLFTPSYMIHINSFYYLKGECLYNYRQFFNSKSKKYKAEWWANFIDLNYKLKNLLADNPTYDFTRQLKLQLIHSALLVLDRIYTDNSLNTPVKKSEIKKIVNHPELKIAFKDLKIKTTLPGLRIILILIKYKMADGYIWYRKLTFKRP